MAADARSRRTLLVAAAGATAAVAGGALAWWRLKPRGGESLPPQFWSHSFPTPQEGQLALASLQGRPLVVNFWATWCPPCVEEMPLLDRFYRENSANGWQVVGIAVDQGPAVRQFLARTPVSFPIGLAGLDGATLGRELGNQAGGLPYTVLISAKGEVLQRKIGQISAAELAQWRSALAD